MNISITTNRLIILLLFYAISLFASSVDSLLSANNIKSKGEQLNFLMEFCFNNRHANPNLALEAGLKAYKIASDIGDTRAQAKSANLVSVIYRSFGNYEIAFSYNIRAAKISQANSDTITLAFAKNNLGHLYRVRGFYDKAISEAMAAYNLFNSVNNIEGIAFASINLGYIYIDIGKYSESIPYIQEAIKLRQQLGDKEAESVALFALGDANLGLKQFEKALEIYNRILESYKSESFKAISIANINAAIGKVYLHKNELLAAARYYETALSESEKLANKKDQIVFAANLIEIYDKLGDDSKAEIYLNRILALIDGFHEWVPLSSALRVIHKHYNNKGNIDKAFYYSQVLNVIGDSITSQSKRESIESMSLVFENKRAQEEDQQIKNDKKGEIENSWVYAVLIFFLIAVIIVLSIKIRSSKALSSP